MRTVLLVAVLALVLAAAGCGRKGELTPPEPRPAAAQR